jgi:hypothetical protein
MTCYFGSSTSGDKLYGASPSGYMARRRPTRIETVILGGVDSYERPSEPVVSFSRGRAALTTIPPCQEKYPQGYWAREVRWETADLFQKPGRSAGARAAVR